MADEEHETGGDVAAEAFEEVRAEVTLLRRAIERLAAERAELPEQHDYSETLGSIAKATGALAQRVDVLAKAAEDAVVPRYVADRIVAAGSSARAEDQRTIATARQSLEDAARTLHGLVVSARRSDEQNRWLTFAALGGLLLGMVLWAALAGVVARAMPANWLWPEKMAARSLARPMWEGGQRMMRAAAPDAFAAIAAGDQIITSNRQVLKVCQKRANKAREKVQCTVSVAPVVS